MPTTTLAIILFVATYIGLLALPDLRAYVALGSAALFVALGILPLAELLPAVDWNVILMIAGTMGTVSLFIQSRMPARLADLIIARVPDVKWAIISLSVFAGLISAFVDNVATVLMVAPVALGIAKKLGISPVTSIIAIAIASNLEGAATLVGDTTSILLGGYTGMNFLDFFFMEGRVGLFFTVQLAVLAATLVLLMMLRGESQPISASPAEEVKDYFPTWLLLLTVALLVVASLLPIPDGFPINGVICAGTYLLGLGRCLLKRDTKQALSSLREIDLFTLLLLASLFCVIAGVRRAGVIDLVAQLFLTVSGGNLFLMYTLIVWFSVLLSAFIDNIPYVATMLPVVTALNASLGMEGSYLLYFGLLAGATLGGNLTPIGASANIAALGILRREGHQVKAGTFMRLSIPYTLAAVTCGYLLIWLIWKP